ncbi:hypothetical protein E4T56_gene5232, partial [Termitomyces sp. T112]
MPRTSCCSDRSFCGSREGPRAIPAQRGKERDAHDGQQQHTHLFKPERVAEAQQALMPAPRVFIENMPRQQQSQHQQRRHIKPMCPPIAHARQTLKIERGGGKIPGPERHPGEDHEKEGQRPAQPGRQPPMRRAMQRPEAVEDLHAAMQSAPQHKIPTGPMPQSADQH